MSTTEPTDRCLAGFRVPHRHHVYAGIDPLPEVWFSGPRVAPVERATIVSRCVVAGGLDCSIGARAAAEVWDAARKERDEDRPW